MPAASPRPGGHRYSVAEVGAVHAADLGGVDGTASGEIAVDKNSAVPMIGMAPAIDGTAPWSFSVSMPGDPIRGRREGRQRAYEAVRTRTCPRHAHGAGRAPESAPRHPERVLMPGPLDGVRLLDVSTAV